MSKHVQKNISLYGTQLILNGVSRKAFLINYSKVRVNSLSIERQSCPVDQ